MKEFIILIILLVSVMAQINENNNVKESYNIVSSVTCECTAGVKCVPEDNSSIIIEIKERPKCSKTDHDHVCCAEWEQSFNSDSINNLKETHIISNVTAKCECSVGVRCGSKDYSTPRFEIKERPKCSSNDNVCCAEWEEAESDEENPTTTRSIDNESVMPQKNKKCSYFDLNDSKNSFLNVKDLLVKLPWAVIVNGTNRTSSCVGSLIHENVVLTSASCVYSSEAKNLLIRAGNLNQVRGAVKIDQHAEFKHLLPKSNLALITLDQPMSLSPDLQVLCLPEQNEKFDTENCVTLVKSSSESYPPGDVSVISSELCDLAAANMIKLVKDKIMGPKENYICARSKNILNACQTFQSNPLICPLSRDKNLFTQIGILAQVVRCENKESVPQHGYQIFTDIKKEIDWIRKTAKTLGYELFLPRFLPQN